MNTGDLAWVLISTALVMLMIPAVGLFYGGMVRKKNLLSTIMLSFSLLAVISVQWVLYGYSITFGPDKGGFIGSFQWFGLNGVGYTPNSDYAGTIPHLAFVLFQMMFAVITPALITGGFVERIKFSTFLVFSVIWSTIVYNPVAHWIWGAGGWLRNMGALDFAGGTTIHITAGVAALAVALVIRKRKGYGEITMEPNSIPLTIIGTMLLWFGWFGFNGGSALGSNNTAVSALLATNIGGASGALTWMLISWFSRRPSAIGVATGAVVGLASITPAAGYVSPSAALIIGAVGAIIGYSCIRLRDRLRIDETLDVWACHGMGGTWGTLATGLFASKAINPSGANGLLHGNLHFFLVQLLMVVVVWIFTFAVTYALAKVLDAIMGLSVKDEEEVVGLDISQHGEEAYAIL